MPHTRLTHLTYTIHGTTETDLVAAARNRLTQTVTDPEQWSLDINADAGVDDQPQGHVHIWNWTGTVTATRQPPPVPKDLPDPLDPNHHQ